MKTDADNMRIRGVLTRVLGELMVDAFGGACLIQLTDWQGDSWFANLDARGQVLIKKAERMP